MPSSKCPKYESCSAPRLIYWNGQPYSLYRPGEHWYYRNTRTHRKLARDLYEFCNEILLRQGEVIHHKDGNTLNDALPNLERMTRGEHTTLHCTGILNPGASAWNRINKRGKAYTKGMKFQKRFCIICGQSTHAKDMCKHHYFQDYNRNRRHK